MTSNLLAAGAAVLLIVRIVLFVAVHVVGREYSIVRHAVSDYAVGPTSRLSGAMTWVTAGAWALLAGAVGTQDGGGDGTHGIVIWLVVLTAIFVVLPWLPTDIEGERLTRTGILHYVAAIAWFAISFSTAGDLVDWTRGIDGGLSDTLDPIHLVALVALVVTIVGLLPALRSRFFGLAERAFLVAITVFYLVTALGLVVA